MPPTVYVLFLFLFLFAPGGEAPRIKKANENLKNLKNIVQESTSTALFVYKFYMVYTLRDPVPSKVHYRKKKDPWMTGNGRETDGKRGTYSTTGINRNHYAAAGLPPPPPPQQQPSPPPTPHRRHRLVSCLSRQTSRGKLSWEIAVLTLIR